MRLKSEIAAAACLAAALLLPAQIAGANSKLPSTRCWVTASTHESCGCGEYAEVCDPPPAGRDTCQRVCVKKRFAWKHYWTCADGRNYTVGGC